MPSASLDTSTLLRGSVWRGVRYCAFFALITLMAMAIKSALEWDNRLEWSLLLAAGWVGLLMAGPVEALSQRSVPNARRMTRQTAIAAIFAALWAAGVSAVVALLAFPLDRNFAYLVVGSAVVGAVLAAVPPTTGGTIQ